MNTKTLNLKLEDNMIKCYSNDNVFARICRDINEEFLRDIIQEIIEEYVFGEVIMDEEILACMSGSAS